MIKKKKSPIPKCVQGGQPPCTSCPAISRCNYGNTIVNVTKQSSHLLERADETVKRRMDKGITGSTVPDLW